MTLKIMRPMLWIALWLIALEVGLEYRAARRGWSTILFGAPAVPASEGRSDRFGPRAGFPFRSPIVEPARPDGMARIWIASSSYGEDILLAPDRIFAHLTARLLADGGAPTEVLNASRAGYATPANTSQLRDLGPIWRPDVVVLYQLSNDIDVISNALLGQAGGGNLAGVGVADEGREQAAPNLSRRWAAAIDALLEQTTTYAQLKNQITSRLSGARVHADTVGAKGAEAWEARLRDFLAACHDVGARPVLCTFATSHDLARRDAFPGAWADNLFRYNIHLSVEGWMNSVRQLNDVTRRVAAEEGVPLVDLEAALTGRVELFRDFTHFTPQGHQQVAALLARALSERVRPRRGEDE